MNRIMCAVALVSVVAGLAAQPAPTVEEIASLIRGELEAARVPGAAIAVVVGETMHAAGYGLADTETRAPMRPTTLVHTGSLTKVFTALAVVTSTLESRGMPVTPVGAHVPGLSPRAAATTFHQLLSQTSGLRDRAGDYGSDAESDLQQSAKALVERDFLLPPDTVFSYSNLGYALAGAALEAVRKQPYADAMRDAVFAPLGMKTATLRPAEARRAGHAAGHRLEKDTWTVVTPLANDTRIWPAGYMWSSALDVRSALFALMHEGRIDGKQAIPAAASGA